MTGTTGPIGFAGIGRMGAPMVNCLARAGHKVLAFDPDRKALAQVADIKGVSMASDLRSLGAACAIVITMLPTGAIVREAVLATGGIAEGMKKGATLIDMSSSEPVGTRELGAELEKRGITLIDAPVSGGVGKAKDGTLAIMAGGDSAAIDRVEGVLSAMGKVFRAGPLGAGHAIKALNNYVSSAGLAATCEAVLIARAFGLDAEVMTDIINASTGWNNTTQNKLKRFILSEAFDAGFALNLMDKDVGMARDLAHSLGIEAPTLKQVSALLHAASQKLGPPADHTELFRYLENINSGKGKG
ncbi:MAG: NAD(P)-dependent oxidoreductase [Pseudomonadota bacterium]|nr:NAD(P)-dependent oxidoreductase [Pseudomonadota bacterium]